VCLPVNICEFADSRRSWVTYFFKRKFNLSEGQLGSIFSVTGVISALSIFVASSISKRIGNVKVSEAKQSIGVSMQILIGCNRLWCSPTSRRPSAWR
jgi:Na+/melibiose symporter-like transporter